jgi:hypothetical protein
MADTFAWQYFIQLPTALGTVLPQSCQHRFASRQG